MSTLPLLKKKLLLPSHVVKNVLINTPPRRMLHLAFQWGHSWRRGCKKKKRCDTRSQSWLPDLHIHANVMTLMFNIWAKTQSCKVEANPPPCMHFCPGMHTPYCTALELLYNPSTCYKTRHTCLSWPFRPCRLWIYTLYTDTLYQPICHVPPFS